MFTTPNVGEGALGEGRMNMLISIIEPRGVNQTITRDELKLPQIIVLP